MSRILTPLSDETLMNYKVYSQQEIDNAILILSWDADDMHKFDVVRDELFAELSNYYQLENPLYDEFNNEYYDSEGLYMALRTNNQAARKEIATMSKHFGKARKARKIYGDILEQDELKRVHIMRQVVKQKFDNNPMLQQFLYNTWDNEIIEYTFWWDRLFGIDQSDKWWRSVLGKLQMEYRDLFLN